jgi:hypothetical protein
MTLHRQYGRSALRDYYLLETYEAVRDLKAAGRLPHCHLIFSNIELRLGLQTKRPNSSICICQYAQMIIITSTKPNAFSVS